MRLSKLIFYGCLLWLVGVCLTSCKEPVSISEPGPPEELLCSTQGDGENAPACVQQQSETFVIDSLESKEVDFLFVLDVSESMTQVLASLGESFKPLMSHIQNTNWQMFFTTADHGDHTYRETTLKQKVFSQAKWEDYLGHAPHFGKLLQLEHEGQLLDQTVLTPTTPHYTQVFKDTLTKKPEDTCELAPSCQGSHEQPLRSLMASLSRYSPAKEEPSLGIEEEETSPRGLEEEETHPPSTSLARGEQDTKTPSRGEQEATTPTLRAGATLITFIITNEDERTEDPTNATKAEDVLEHVNTLFTKDKPFHTFGIMILDDDSEESATCLKQQQSSLGKDLTTASRGKVVGELALLTGGHNISVCEKDFGPPLQDISHLLRSRIQSLQLKESPLPNSLEIKLLKGTGTIGEWTLEGKTLLFKEALPAGSEIEVSYSKKIPL